MAICPVCGEDEEAPNHDELHDTISVTVELPFLIFRSLAQEIDYIHDIWMAGNSARIEQGVRARQFEAVFPALDLLNDVIGGSLQKLTEHHEGQDNNGATPS